MTTRYFALLKSQLLQALAVINLPVVLCPSRGTGGPAPALRPWEFCCSTVLRPDEHVLSMTVTGTALTEPRQEGDELIEIL